MSTQKRQVNLWLVAGLILSLCTLLTAVYGITNGPAVLLDTAAVTEAADQTLQCACTGDFDALSQLLWSTPDLGEAPEKEQTADSLIWYTYLDSFQYELDEECRASGSGMEVDVRIQCLDIAAVTQSLQTLVPTLMTQSEAAKASEEEITKVLFTAASQLLKKDPPMTSQQITLQLVRTEGRWQVLPTESLQQLLSGFVSA